MEFAVVLPLLLLFIFGIIEFGLAFNRLHAFQAAASEAGKAASVGFDLEDPEHAEEAARIRQIAASTVDEADVEVLMLSAPCGPQPGGGPPPETVEVSVRLQASARAAYRMNIPGIVFGSDPDYEATTVLRCEVGR